MFNPNGPAPHAGPLFCPESPTMLDFPQAAGRLMKSWGQTIPHLPGLEGMNLFEMTVADVTPPPYPPSGDTGRDNCTVTGTAP